MKIGSFILPKGEQLTHFHYHELGEHRQLSIRWPELKITGVLSLEPSQPMSLILPQIACKRSDAFKIIVHNILIGYLNTECLLHMGNQL
jgi:hypothetical protein